MTVDKNEKKLSESQQASLTMLRAMGRSERDALLFIAKSEKERDGQKQPTAKSNTRAIKLTEDGGKALRREAFANLQFRPHGPTRKMSSTSIARLMTAHNAGESHDRTCCPACCARG